VKYSTLFSNGDFFLVVLVSTPVDPKTRIWVSEVNYTFESSFEGFVP